MAGLLYFLPGRDRDVKLADAQAAGLGYAFERSLDPCAVARGPDGAAGVIVAEADTAPKLGMYADEQTWRKVPGTECWVGMFTAAPPKPDELARRELLDGHLVTLGDGQQWLAPMARRIVEYEGQPVGVTVLPRRRQFDADGRWTRGGPVAKYARLWDVAERWWQEILRATANDALQFEFDDENDAATVALAANYRIGPAEVDLLGLFDDDSVSAILCALVDRPTMEAWARRKKKASSADAG